MLQLAVCLLHFSDSKLIKQIQTKGSVKAKGLGVSRCDGPLWQWNLHIMEITNKTNSVTLSPQANYTD
jgi:hypothetical protein